MKKLIYISLSALLAAALLVGCYDPALSIDPNPKSEISGLVIETGSDYFTLLSDSLTCKLHTDSSTLLEGDSALDINDKVTAIYTGDLSADALAVSVSVTEAAPAGTAVIEGIIIDLSGNSAVISARDGGFYAFFAENATYTNADAELKAGDDVAVTYSGDLSSRPAAVDIRVTSEAQSSPQARDFAGTVVEISDEVIILGGQSGGSYAFVRADAGIETDDEEENIEPAAGDEITVTFTGALTERPKAVSFFVTAASATPPETLTLSGECAELSDGGLSITVDSGETFYVGTDDDVFSGAEPAVGDLVTVTYEGQALDGDAEATAVSVDMSRGIANGRMSGQIVSFTDETIEITDGSGRAHEFNLNDGTDISGTPEEDAYAAVVYTASDFDAVLVKMLG